MHALHSSGEKTRPLVGFVDGYALSDTEPTTASRSGVGNRLHCRKRRQDRGEEAFCFVFSSMRSSSFALAACVFPGSSDGSKASMQCRFPSTYTSRVGESVNNPLPRPLHPSSCAAQGLGELDTEQSHPFLTIQSASTVDHVAGSSTASSTSETAEEDERKAASSCAPFDAGLPWIDSVLFAGNEPL